LGAVILTPAIGPATVGASGVSLFSTAQAASRADSVPATRTFRVFIRNPSRKIRTTAVDKGWQAHPLYRPALNVALIQVESSAEGWDPAARLEEIGRKS